MERKVGAREDSVEEDGISESCAEQKSISQRRGRPRQGLKCGCIFREESGAV